MNAGEPFETSYNPDACFYMCYAEFVQAQCGCHGFVGWNITRSDCIDDPIKNKCIVFTHMRLHFDESFKIPLEQCLAGCQPKCEQRYFKLDIFRMKNHPLTTFDLEAILQRNDHYISTGTVNGLKNKMKDKRNLSEVVKHTAQITFFFSSSRKWEEMRTIEKVSVSAFISKIGGLIGMWLGLSVMSIVEWPLNAISETKKQFSSKNKCSPGT